MEIIKVPKKIINFRKLKSKCPTCKKKSSNTYTPFCSKKCSDLDLMKWLSDDGFFDKQNP